MRCISAHLAGLNKNIKPILKSLKAPHLTRRSIELNTTMNSDELCDLIEPLLSAHILT